MAIVGPSYEDDPDENARDFRIEGQDVSGFIGVDREYQNYVDDRFKPFAAEGGPDAEGEKKFAEAQQELHWGSGSGSSVPVDAPVTSGAAEDDSEDDDEKEKPKKSAAKKPPAPGVS